MNTTVKEAGPFERLLTLILPAADIEAAKTRAARRLSEDLDIKGFRRGKAPRPIVEVTVGAARLRSEAIEDLLPAKVGEALEEIDLVPAVSPAVEELRDVPEGVEVEVRVTLWPKLDRVPEHHDHRVEVMTPQLTDEEVDQQLTRLREQFASLETVERPAADSDYVAVDITAEHNGLPVEEARATELLYEVGSGGFIAGIDEGVRGKAAGDVVTFGGPLPSGFGDKAGLPVVFTVVVKEVKGKVLPELTDEWAAEATEFETVAELRVSLTERLTILKRRSVAGAFRERAFQTLIDQVDVDLPDAILRAEMDDILHRFAHRLADQGITLEDYFRASGTDQQAFVADLSSQADRNLRGRLLLDAVAEEEQLSVTDEEVEQVRTVLSAAAKDPDSVKSALSGQPQDLAIRGDILRGKALEAIVSAAIPVDANGNPVEIEVIPAEEPPAETEEEADDA